MNNTSCLRSPTGCTATATQHPLTIQNQGCEITSGGAHYFAFHLQASSLFRVYYLSAGWQRRLLFLVLWVSEKL